MSKHTLRCKCGTPITRHSKTGKCLRCANDAKARRPARKCATPGCAIEPSRHSKTGKCARCYLADLAKERDDRLAFQAKAREERLAIQAAVKAPSYGSAEDVLKRENTILRNELSQSRQALKGYAQQRFLEDRLLENIMEYVEQNPYKPMLEAKKERKATPKDHEMLAVISDAHYPEVVDPSAAMGLSYGPEVCRRRVERLRDTIIRYRDLRATSYPTAKLTVAVNGDMLGGNIHEELEVTNAMPMSQALVDMSYMLFDMGQAFASAFPAVEFIVMPGNHARMTKKPRYKQKWDNWEFVMGHFLKALAGDRFAVTIPTQLVHKHDIFGKHIGITHGDGVKAQSFAGIPWYSMKARRDAFQSLMKTLGQPQLDMLVFGHFHQLIYEEGAGCSLLINGSIKGGDDFSVGTRYTAQEPVQALMTFHPRHGMTDLSRVNLGHIV